MYPGYRSVTNHLSSLLEYQLLSMWSLASLGDDIDSPGSQLNLWWFLSCHHPGCPTSFREDLSLNLYNLLEEVPSALNHQGLEISPSVSFVA